MTDKEKDDEILISEGCRRTKSRMAVVNVLKSSKVPLSAEEIYLMIKDSGVSINLSTVYRTLELMSKKNVVSKIMFNDNKARFQLNGKGHEHHLICIGCSKIVPIDICPIKKLEAELGKETNFDITGHSFELYGLCPECKKN